MFIEFPAKKELAKTRYDPCLHQICICNPSSAEQPPIIFHKILHLSLRLYYWPGAPILTTTLNRDSHSLFIRSGTAHPCAAHLHCKTSIITFSYCLKIFLLKLRPLLLCSLYYLSFTCKLCQS